MSTPTTTSTTGLTPAATIDLTTDTSSAVIPLPRENNDVPVPAAMSVTSMPTAANGVPTSVFGFAIVVLMLSLANAGIVGSATMFVPIAMVIGFLAIGIGGLFELRNGDLFGGTFGVVYATFLLATGLTLRFFAPAPDAGADAVSAFGQEIGAFFLLGALLSVVFTVGARLVNRTAVIAFALLAVVLALAGLANIIGGDTGATLTKVAGYVGILDGLAAFWLASGILLNSMHDKVLLPLGAPKA